MARIDDLKKEIQGSSGLITQLKRRLLPFPSPTDLVTGTQERFLGGGKEIENPDKVLYELLSMEFEFYKDKRQDWLDEFWTKTDIFLKESRRSYPLLREIFSKISSRSPESILYSLDSDVLMIGMIVGQSMNQSARTRAGYSLMEHIAWLLEQHGIGKNIYFRREEQLENVKLDFIFPNKEYLLEDRTSTVTCAAMTTMNDRYRLALQQLQPNTIKRILTAIGSNNFGKNLGPKVLTKEKLNEINKENAKVVVLENVRDQISSDTPVITYTEWFNELRELKELW